MGQDGTWHADRSRRWPHCVRWGPSSPSLHRHSPQFSAHICCGQMAGWTKMPLGREVGLSPSDILLDGDPAPLSKRGHSSQLLAHVCCGQTVGWIKMALGTEVGLGPGHIVLDGNAAPPPQKGAQLPNFRPISIEAKRLDASGYHLVRR